MDDLTEQPILSFALRRTPVLVMQPSAGKITEIIMGSIKKSRKAKINKHKRRKARKSIRHKKR